jgi:hypothetical protein
MVAKSVAPFVLKGKTKTTYFVTGVTTYQSYGCFTADFAEWGCLLTIAEITLENCGC